MEAPALDSEPADTRVPPGLSGAVNLFAPEELDGPGLSRTLELLESLIGWAQAGQARILHLLEQHFQDAVANGAPAAAPGRESRADRVRAKRLNDELATSLAATEAACVLRIPERTALGRLRTSRALCEDFPATLGALRDGHLGYRQACTLVDEALSLPIEARAPFEAHLLGKAP